MLEGSLLIGNYKNKYFYTNENTICFVLSSERVIGTNNYNIEIITLFAKKDYIDNLEHTDLISLHISYPVESKYFDIINQDEVLKPIYRPVLDDSYWFMDNYKYYNKLIIDNPVVPTVYLNLKQYNNFEVNLQRRRVINHGNSTIKNLMLTKSFKKGPFNLKITK